MKIKFFVQVLVFACLFSGTLFAQRFGFINTQFIRDKYPDNKLAEQRCQTMIDEWKRELQSMTDKEEALLFDIRKNRLIWSDAEKTSKDRELSDLKAARLQYAKDKFAPNGESDKVTRTIMLPVEEKISAAVQDVASKERLDFVGDQATQPLAYANFKYDITLKVLKLLGVDVSAEEKEQEQKIAADPRNEEETKRQSTTTRRRRRGDQGTQQQENPIQNPTTPVEQQPFQPQQQQTLEPLRKP